MSKGSRDRGHSRENYEHIFRKDECSCDDCVFESARTAKNEINEKDRLIYARRVQEFKESKERNELIIADVILSSNRLAEPRFEEA